MVQGGSGVARQAHLLERAERLARLGSWRLELDTGHVTWSDGMYRLLGVDPEILGGDLGEVMAAAIHPDDRAPVERINTAVARDGVPRPADYRIILPDGSTRWVHAEDAGPRGLRVQELERAPFIGKTCGRLPAAGR